MNKTGYSSGAMNYGGKSDKGTNQFVPVRDVTKNGVEVGKANDGESIYCLQKDVELFNLNTETILKQIEDQGLGELRAVFIIFDVADRSIASIGNEELMDTLYVSVEKNKNEQTNVDKTEMEH